MIDIRRATSADCTTIHDLAWRIFPATYSEILTKEQSDYMMEWMYSLDSLHRQMADGHVYFIARSDGEPIGYVSVSKESEDLFHLQKIYVLPSMQGTGCGRLLFDRAVEHIRSLHPSPCRMELNVNRHNKALEFYKRMGMTIARQGDFAIGQGYYMNDFIMSLDILPQKEHYNRDKE